MKKLNIALVMLMTIFSLIIPSEIGYASEFNFAVNPVIPENQIDKEQSYFDLEMDQGASQTVEVQLRNDTDQDVVIEVSVASATTNLNGVVEYSENQIQPDDTLAYDLEELVEVVNEITIPKGEQINLPLKITMPDESFEGVIAGGITFKEKDEIETENSTEEQGLAIKNEFAYVVAILLRQEVKELEPTLIVKEVSPGQVNSRNVINVHFQNPEAMYLNSLYVKSEVYKKGQKEVLYSAESGNMQMAPNSNFDYPISLDGEPLKAGDYVVKTVAYAIKDENGDYRAVNTQNEEEIYQAMWSFENEFSVTSEVAKDLNQQDVTIEAGFNWLYCLLGVCLLALVFIVSLLRRRKNQKGQST